MTDLETVEQIVSLLKEYPVSEIEMEREGLRVRVRRSASPLPLTPTAPEMGETPSASSVEENAPSEAAPEPVLLTAMMVGLFRHSEPPVGYGARLTPGHIVGSIEAMKVLNDVTVQEGGQVVEVFVEEGAPVEYGQALFRLMPG